MIVDTLVEIRHSEYQTLGSNAHKACQITIRDSVQKQYAGEPLLLNHLRCQAYVLMLDTHSSLSPLSQDPPASDTRLRW